MSSRALRKAQKELEERQRLEQLALADESDDSRETGDEDVSPSTKPKPSLFALLGDTTEGEDEEHAEAEDLEESGLGDSGEKKLAAPLPPTRKGKKKKKKGKSKGQEHDSKPEPATSKTRSDLDDIDRALLALNLTSSVKSGGNSEPLTAPVSEELKQLYSVLSIDTQHLHAANEMRKLFGRAAVERNDDDEPRPRLRGRGQQHGLAPAVAGRNAPGNRNLASLGLRRNIFVQGKEEWPRATSGGLGMEIVQKRDDGTVEYRFVHNMTYQSVQKQFELCVASMDPERMVHLLQFNPYHISTLLQVSEIAKQQRDNATSGDLLERALFSFGRAVHSTFANNISQGKARLDFRRPENREFWLAVWRYIATLGIRATWRTALEWAKLLLSLSPEEDPYCIRLLIDQLALRGREPQDVVDLAESDHLQRQWKIPPNLAFSIALAYDRLKNPSKARSSLYHAINEYPWIASRLCKELDISPIPKSIWGKEPHSDYQELLCQLYVPKAKDLWNTPEATSLLVEVAHSFEKPLDDGLEPYWLARIDETDLARHVILSDDRTLLSLLDPIFKQKFTSVSDPLPPDDNVTSYTISSSPSQSQPQNQLQLLAELERFRAYFAHVDLGRRVNLEDERTTQEDFLRALAEAGTNMEEFRRNTESVQMLRVRLQELGMQVVFDDDGEDGGQDNREGSLASDSDT